MSRASAAAWRTRHLERARARDRARYAANPERFRAEARTRRDPVTANASSAAWREAHPERAAELYRRWRIKNPDKARTKEQTRRARELKAFIERVDLAVVWERDQGRCYLCGDAADPTNWHLEHVVALANGGEHSYANTRVAHPLCNLRKGTR